MHQLLPACRIRVYVTGICSNNTSSIKSTPPAPGPLLIKLEKLDVTYVHGEPTIKSKGLANDGTTPVKIGDYFRFNITNNSDQSLFVVVVWIGSTGSVGLYSPTNTGELILPGKSLTTRPPLRAGPPQGLETSKLSRPRSQASIFIFFNNLVSPRLLCHRSTQTGNTATRDPSVASELDVGDWTTGRHDIFIQR
jgi:hypothetical protein